MKVRNILQSRNCVSINSIIFEDKKAYLTEVSRLLLQQDFDPSHPSIGSPLPTTIGPNGKLVPMGPDGLPVLTGTTPDGIIILLTPDGKPLAGPDGGPIVIGQDGQPIVPPKEDSDSALTHVEIEVCNHSIPICT